ncbi:MAG: hypothetical protein HC880_07470 [Bacteroidia bacterium]|nr:hypothetical protein [Bacteroidia bacterium]
MISACANAIKKDSVFNEFKVNPAGTKIAYSETRNGKFRVVVRDLQTRRRKVLLRTGYKAINQRFDEDVPTLAWRDNNNLGIMYMKRGEARLSVFNQKKKKSYERIWYYFNHINGFDFSDDGNSIVISADRKGQPDFKTGQNDIFIFDMEKTNLEQITDDWFDDLSPTFLPNSNLGFVFSSNRTDDTLSTTLLTDRGNYNVDYNNFDLFIYNPQQSSTRLLRLTKSPAPDIRPRFLNEDNVIYLNGESGILQLKKVNINTRRTQTLTNYNQSIRQFDVNPAENGLAFLMIRKGRLYPFYKRDFDFDQNLRSDFRSTRMQVLDGSNPQERVNIPEGFQPEDEQPEQTTPENEYAPDEVDTDNYQFDPEIVEEKQSGLDKKQEEMLERARQESVRVIGPYDYEPRFRTENVLTSIQIHPLLNWGTVVNMSTSDLLENHKIRGGFYLLTDLRSNSFFAEYQYYARRLDYKIRYDRNRIYFNSDGFIQIHALNKVTATVSYPITNTNRISFSPFYTNTVSTLTGPLNTIQFGAPFSRSLVSDPDNWYHYLGFRMEYVFDNTVVNGQNMIDGTRNQGGYEKYYTALMSDHIRDAGASNSDYNFAKISVDIRNYTKIHRDLIFATRVAYGRFENNTPAGDPPKSFMLGGMDNWLFNRRDGGGVDIDPVTTNTLFANGSGNDIAIFGNENLLFNEFVTNLRGFNYNRLAGENFFLVNAELRFPIIKYLFGRRINSNFLKNLQLVGFYDIGSAWTGISPFNRENSLNTRNVGNDQSPFIAVVKDFTNPWLSGYGAGLRTVLLGYYLKVDVAWAIEDFIVADKPKFYFTFGYDF